MKKIIYSIAAGIIMTLGLSAQTRDSLLIRQMELERDFNPTLMESNKVNSLPTLRQPTVQKANTNYSTWNVNATPPLEIAIPRPGNMMTQIPYSKEKGYLYFAGGNYANMDGVFGYRVVDTDNDKLSVNFFHNSTNGNINYVQEGVEDKTKAKFMDNKGQLKYDHQFSKFMLNTQASYLHSSFNYYGNTMGSPKQLEEKNQQLGMFNLNLAVESDKNDAFEYRGFFDLKNFSSKYADNLSGDGLKGNQIEAVVGVNKPLSTIGNGIGVDGRILNTFYNNNLKNYLLVSAAPYIDFKGLDWNARLGADILIHIIGKTQIRIAPNIQLKYSPLYLNIRGGYDSNTFPNMWEESRYINPNTIVKPSFSIVDIELGAKIMNLDAFRFDIYGGYKHTEDEHFLILDTHKDTEGILSTREFLVPKYADMSHSHAGARIQTTIWNPLNVTFSIKKNFYTIKGDDKAMAWNKPGFEADVRADLSIIENLKLTLNYYLAGDRWSYYDASNVKMDNINDLNLGAVYQISSAFAVNLKANNVLAQKYDIWYGHPAQGFNMMGGFSFKF